jgi:hypothetical protein
MREIAEAICVLLPAGVANATPSRLKQVPGTVAPSRGGRKWHRNVRAAERIGYALAIKTASV